MIRVVYWPEGAGVTLNGLAMNQGPNTRFVVTDIDGLGGPDVRVETGGRYQAHGNWAGKAYLQARTITLTGRTHAASTADLELARDELDAAVTLEAGTVVLHRASGAVRGNVRRGGEVKWRRLYHRLAEWSVVLVADDPRLWVDGAEFSGTVGMPHTEGGLLLPATTPWTLNSTTVDDSLDFVNPYAGGRLELTVHGYVEAPEIHVTNTDGHKVLRWNTILPSGWHLDVDPERQEALLQGQTARPPARREWPRLTAGANSFALRADRYSEEARLHVHAYPAI